MNWLVKKKGDYITLGNNYTFGWTMVIYKIQLKRREARVTIKLDKEL